MGEEAVKTVAVEKVEPSQLGATTTVSTKPGFRTSEFVVVAIVVLSAVLEQLKELLKEGGQMSPFALIAAATAAGAYALARALSKRQ
jgi:hypothetical protein